MATEEGIVTKINKTAATIRTTRKTACESCHERHGCINISDSREMELEADNPINAQVGDRVIISLQTGHLLRLTFLLYIFPILLMIIGALLGNHIAVIYHADSSLLSVGFGFLFFFIAFGFVKLQDMRARKTGRYRPVIIRIKKKG